MLRGYRRHGKIDISGKIVDAHIVRCIDARFPKLIVARKYFIIGELLFSALAILLCAISMSGTPSRESACACAQRNVGMAAGMANGKRVCRAISAMAMEARAEVHRQSAA